MPYIYRHINDQYEALFNSFFTIECNGNHLTRADLIIPDCTPGIMFIEEGTLIRTHRGEVQEYESGKAYLFGQKTVSAEYTFYEDSFKAHGYKLVPAGLQLYFGMAADSLTDKSTVLSKSDLPRSFWNCSDEKNPFDHDQNLPSLLQEFLLTIHRRKGDIHIKKAADRFQVGYKQLERMFKQYIGITPKLYARIVRFNHSLKMIDHPYYQLTDIAYQSGYFDQNHFIKESKKFTGHTPSKLFTIKKTGLEKSQLDYLATRRY